MNFWLLVAMRWAPFDLRTSGAGELLDLLDSVGRQVPDDVNEALGHQSLCAPDQERRRIAGLVALDPLAHALQRAARVLTRIDRSGLAARLRLQRSGGVCGGLAAATRCLATGVGDALQQLLQRHEIR